MRSIRTHLMVLLFLPMAGSAQSVSGFWHGSAFISGEDGDQNSYMVELILTDNGRSVQGVLNYYFLNIFRSIPINATFDRTQQALIFKDIPFVYYGSNPKMDVDCYMNGRFNLVLARAGSSLSGQWRANDDYKNTCPPIQARLHLDKDQKMTDSVVQAIKNIKANYQVWVAPPSIQDEKKGNSPTEISSTPPNKEEALAKQTISPITNPSKSNPISTSPVSPTTKSNTTSITVSDKEGKTKKKSSLINKLFSKKKQSEKTKKGDKTSQRKQKKGISPSNEPQTSIGRVITDPFARKKVIEQEFELEVDTVLISLYDNGEIDGDTISVLLNETTVVSRQLLSARPIQFKIPLDSLSEFVEVVMVAENLGSIPPNTALMIVEAGGKSYKIGMSSSLDVNSSIRIKRKRKGLRIR